MATKRKFSETLPVDKLKSVFSFLNEIGLKEAAQALFKESKLDKTKLTGGPITNLNQLFEAQEKSSVTKKARVEEPSSDESSDSESEAEMAVVQAAKPSQPSPKKKKAALTGGGRGRTSESKKEEKKVKIVFKEDGNKFLDLTGVPNFLKERSGLKTYLYLRDCYDDLIEDISSCVSRDIPGKSKRIAILGTAGIGKSALFLVILKRLLKDPNTLGLTTRSFYYQTSPAQIWLYRHVQVDEFSLRFVESCELLDEGIPLFADMDTADGSPHGHLGPFIIFTSFRPSRFKELVKNGWRKVMPTWSAEEQAYLFNSTQFEREFGKEVAQRAYDNMQFFGGAIRNSIQIAIEKKNPLTVIEAAIYDKGELVAERFFKAGFGGTEDVIADVLVHRNPPVVNGKHQFGEIPYAYFFASPFVLRSLLQLKNHMLAAQARNKYKADTFRGGEDGSEFERLCLYGFKISGVEFLAKPLTEGAKKIRVTFPPKEVLAPNWREQKKYLKQEVLYIPPYDNLESGDAFCLIKIDERWTLVILQCTISKTHPVKQNGVKIIRDCYSKNSELAVEETVIMFMTPANGKLETEQPLVTKNGTVVQHPSVKVEAQYKIENKLVSVDDIVA